MKKLPILLVLAFATGAQAQTLEDAVAAYQKGELETAAQQFAALAEVGDAKAQYNLAVLYEKGEGVAQDSDKALAWYQKAAEAGNVNAQYNLGLAYETGEGVAQDYGKARAYYEKAAAQGDADAQNNLGGLYARGDGVKKDLKKSTGMAGKSGCARQRKRSSQFAGSQSAVIAIPGKPWSFKEWCLHCINHDSAQVRHTFQVATPSVTTPSSRPPAIP